MSKKSTAQPGEPAPNPLLDEAISWCLRMHGEDADQHRAAFEAWLSLGGVHRQVYSEVSELYGFGEKLRGVDLDRTADQTQEPRHAFHGPRWKGPALTAALAIFMGIGVFYFEGKREAAPDRLARRALGAPGQLQTALGEIRTIRLDDGSMVTLDTDSLVTVEPGRSNRRLRLERGRIRLAVATASRPFVVAAGAGTITTLGSLFDIGLSRYQEVDMSFLRGTAELRTAGKWSALRPSNATRVAKGYRASYGPDGRTAIAKMARDELAATDWPSGLMSFDGVPLAQVLGHANRYGVVKIILADPALGQRRFYGTVRLNDTRRLAAVIAHALSLQLLEEGGTIRLSPT
ncbi:DUF4880 domain-containing protein [Sphingobium sp. AR-3-1]|uniref:DUF4880 domain-containing protein n=1 Tax=Sphingobium psychrophilum TaxID=2728834 RepID=A0A7X9ZTM9_9SPHN|nr:FecR domain-containing protein [Sphingobium psychrophilum]NML12188.1 DUF4880 domain-containing protein [Sphingobium psychrophilum]